MAELRGNSLILSGLAFPFLAETRMALSVGFILLPYRGKSLLHCLPASLRVWVFPPLATGSFRNIFLLTCLGGSFPGLG